MIIKGFFSLFFRLSIHCDPSLEPSRRDGSKEGSQCMFLLRNKKLFLNYPKYPLLSKAMLFNNIFDRKTAAINIYRPLSLEHSWNAVNNQCRHIRRYYLEAVLLSPVRDKTNVSVEISRLSTLSTGQRIKLFL